MTAIRKAALPLAIVLACLAVWFWQTRKQPGDKPASAPADAPALFRTAQPVSRAFVRRIPWTGKVVSQASVTLKTTIPGRVEAIDAPDQAPVAPGTVILRLGGTRVEAKRRELTTDLDLCQQQEQLARQTLQTAEKALAEEQAMQERLAKVQQPRIDLAQTTVQRTEQSAKAGLATQDQVAAARASGLQLAEEKERNAQESARQLRVATEHCAQAKADLLARQTELKNAKTALDVFESQTQVAAPATGVFASRQVSVGQDVAPGQALGTVVDTSRLRIVAKLFPPPNSDLQDREARVDTGDGQFVSGSVQSVLPMATETGAVTVWIVGDEISHRLRLGQTLSGEVVIQPEKPSLAVPVSAVVYDREERAHVFVTQDGTYEDRQVTTGMSQDGWVQIRSGLERTDKVVAQGAYELLHQRFNEQFTPPD